MSLLLGLMLFTVPARAMLQLPDTSTIVLSKEKAVGIFAGTALLGAGGMLYAQSEAINQDNIGAILAVGGVGAAAWAYSLWSVTPERRFEQLKREHVRLNKHKILELNSQAQEILNGKDEASRQNHLTNFINRHFTQGIKSQHFPRIIARDACCDLEKELESAQQIAEQLKGCVHEDELSSIVQGLSLSKNFALEFKAAIISDPDYRSDIEVIHKAKAVDLKEQKLNFGTKLSSFMPILSQPLSKVLMVFLQVLLRRFNLDI